MAEERGVVTIEADFSHIPVRPTSAREVRELELALIIGTLFRPEVMKSVFESREFTTWVDSLAVAAGALARDKAGYPLSKIADELGRTEATIRRHLAGETKAGQLVKETYEMLVRGKLQISIPALVSPTELKDLKEELASCKESRSKLEETLKGVAEGLNQAIKSLQELYEKAAGTRT